MSLNKPETTIHKILDLARWAPSGDNTQPWRFEIIDDHNFIIHGRYIGENCVYDLEGDASEIALGILIETLTLAATQYNCRLRADRREEIRQKPPIFDVQLEPDQTIKPDPLVDCIEKRSVQRRPLKTRPLSSAEKEAVSNSIDTKKYRILWLEGFNNRLRTAFLMFNNANIRLTIPEAYEEHKKVIEWRAQYSKDRIPDQALGTDPVLTRTMEWAMKSWGRINALNHYAAGTWLPRIEMDLIPGIACAAHFVIIANETPQQPGDYTQAGRAIQRFWLTVTQLDLQLQPETTPLIFRKYVTHDIPFTCVAKGRERARACSRQLEQLIGKQNANQAVFMGRIGAGKKAEARSKRERLENLIST
ncbi:MAG: nitroreductase family protein [Candidatus Polarisedimenticolaceae bacterium]|nr:nitroreductase family protein [Candidatus Polarisedimenticolaceae bacterium]